MGRILRNILAGAGNVLVLWPGSSYHRPARGEFREDARNLSRDFKTAARGLSRTATRYREQVDLCQR